MGKVHNDLRLFRLLNSIGSWSDFKCIAVNQRLELSGACPSVSPFVCLSVFVCLLACRDLLYLCWLISFYPLDK